jgi:hypothetical protein
MAEPMQPPTVTGRVRLKIADEIVEIEVTAPSGPSTLEALQPVLPVSEPEARALARLVEDLPEPRRSQVRARFADVLEQLEAHGLLDRAHAAQRDGDFRAFGVDYLLSGIACPFLEAEACSIHPHRPLACREYLVSSPPEVCAYPVRERLKPIQPVGQPSLALREVGKDQTPGGWVLLAEALDWANAHPAPAPERTGPQLIEAVFARYAAEG